MKKKVDLFCVECGKFLGQYYGEVNKKELINNSKYVLCSSPNNKKTECCSGIYNDVSVSIENTVFN